MKGRKRHIVVDVLGLVLGCYVTSANTADVKAAPAVLGWVLEQFARIVEVLADQGYRGELGALANHFFATQERSVEVELSQRSTAAKGFQVEPKRWIVERTWTWLENARALTRDYETLPHKSCLHDLCGHDSLDATEVNQQPSNEKIETCLTDVYKQFLRVLSVNQAVKLLARIVKATMNAGMIQ